MLTCFTHFTSLITTCDCATSSGEVARLAPALIVAASATEVTVMPALVTVAASATLAGGRAMPLVCSGAVARNQERTT